MSTVSSGNSNSNAANVTRYDYQDKFEPSAFLNNNYKASKVSDIPIIPSKIKHKLKCLHESFLSIPQGVKVLDFGAGPVIASTISAATKASEIVLAEYSDNNLKHLHEWLKNEPEQFDWSPHFSYVVQELEGKGESEAKERQDQVRRLVKAVVHCDITQNPPIEKGFDDLYDVVMCSLVIDGTATSLEEYRASVSRLVSLIKPGGSILYYGVENSLGYYPVGDCNFPSLYVSDEAAVKAFTENGIKNVTVSYFPAFPGKTFRFIKGTYT